MKGYHFLLFFGFVTLFGCATSYESASYSYPGGDDQTFIVGFKGAPYVGQEKAGRYAHRRASEQCKQVGYKNYDIISQSNKEKTYATPSSLSCYGSQCYHSGGAVVGKPSVEIIIRCKNPWYK